ncbi:Exosome component 10 [Blattella germanica]|nr:Exosome component 10 [Blattella germanica]
MDAGGSNSSGNQEMEIVEGNAGTQEIIPGFQTFEAFRQAAFKSLMEATRNSNNLPINENWDYYSSFAPFKRIMNAEGVKVLELIRMVLQHQGMKGNILRRDFEEKFDLIVEANDSILERVSCNLDELSGIRKDPQPNLLQTTFTAPISGSWNVNKAVSTNSFRRNSVTAPIRKFGPENMQRPQIKFKDKVDNSSAPFEPRIKDKPNSLKPLSILLEFNEDGDESFGHPYECELDHFKPPPAQLKRVEPCLFKPIDETPLIHVERKDQLTSLVEDLAKYSEIAVDLEHHSYRTFQGITCLMQISTRDTDYIIDTLELRSDLHCLNEVFTKPSIVKVFHGADHDVEWLQRDLCLYVVNMFDTHQAAKLLNFPQLSLAFLLKHYCGVLADKHFQLADWRIRPLPEELIAYARDDTHYLLYIYDMMKNALLDAANGQDNILSSLYQISTELCKKRYEKPKLREDSHMILYKRNRKLFDNRQLHALKELYKWRDKLARDEDESIGYVLPNHMMLQIAETLPREMQGILACCNPIPTMVRQNLLALHYIILEAREQPLVKVRANTQTWSKINLDGPLHCPHDLTHQHDFRDDLPTLLAGTLKDNKSSKKPAEKLKMNPTISVFEVATSDEENDHSKHVAFICPYERYKRVKPFIQSQEIVKNEEETVQNGEDQDSENSERIKRVSIY